MTSETKESKYNERNRQLFRAACRLLLLILAGAVFYRIWMKYYNPFLRYPYVRKGNYFVTGLYVVLFILIENFYGNMKLGYHRTFNIVFGLMITSFLTNFSAYFVIVTQAATWLLNPVPVMLFASIEETVLGFFWGVLFNRLFYRIFPPNSLLLIAGKKADEAEAKFAARSDRYKITRTILLEEDAADLNEARKYYAELERYDGVVIGDLTAELRNDILKNCYSRSVRTYTLPKVTDIILKSSETLEVFDSPLFLNRNSGIGLADRIVKRASDIVMSLIGLIAASPFMLVIAAAIKIEDGGPVFFRQRRCTKDGKEFDILKFRSMIVNAETCGISVPATERDPRITKVGAVIRATRLDEVPQLINILKGEMSVVGPRPERIEHVKKYTEDIPEFRYRMSVKGGLTGYAQVYGKYNTNAYDKLKLDLLYIQNYSIVLDLEIILKTIQILFTKESTEGFGTEQAKEMTEASRGK